VNPYLKSWGYSALPFNPEIHTRISSQVSPDSMRIFVNPQEPKVCEGYFSIWINENGTF